MTGPSKIGSDFAEIVRKKLRLTFALSEQEHATMSMFVLNTSKEWGTRHFTINLPNWWNAS
jgi:hypothetical protein